MVAKFAHNHNTTQNTTHILHNNQQNEPTPYPQRLCPLSPWVGQRRPQILAPHLPMGPLQVPDAGFAHATAVSLVWDKFWSHINKKRNRGGIGLRWPPFYKYIQQSYGSWRPGWGIYWGGSKARAECVGGVRSHRFCHQTEHWKQRKIKVHLGLRRRPFEILPRNNQPKTCFRAWWWYKGVVQMEWDSGEGCYASFWWQLIGNILEK